MEPSSNAAKKPDSINFEGLSEIKKGEVEFDKAEYLIQMHLGSISAKVTRLYSLADSEANQSLVKKFKIFTNEGGKPTLLHSVIPVSELDPKTNHINEVLTRGFEIPESGVFVPCGISNMKIDKSSGEVAVLLSKVAVKKTHTLMSAELSFEKINSVFKTQRFDSILVQEEEGKDDHPFKSNYILFNDKQILPTHLAVLKHMEITYGVCNRRAHLDL